MITRLRTSTHALERTNHAVRVSKQQAITVNGLMPADEKERKKAQ